MKVGRDGRDRPSRLRSSLLQPARGQTPGTGAVTDGDGIGPDTAEVRQTLLLPLLFEQVEDDLPVTVLDVGAGVPETVTFLSRYRCRVHFAGLFDAHQLVDVPDEDADAYLDEVFAGLLGFPDGTLFDVCLLWDFLSFLPVPALRAFSRALAPYLHRGTRGHGFGAFKANAPAMRRDAPSQILQYGVRDGETLVARPRGDGLGRTFSHSRAVLAENLSCFEIARGTLLREGTMELLLQAR